MGSLNQKKNVFSVKLRWNLLVGAWAVDTRCQSSVVLIAVDIRCQPYVVLIDVFIWTHGTFHTGLRRLAATLLSVASGHAARGDSNQAVSFECLYARTQFFFSPSSFRAVVSLRLDNRIWWCYMWNMKISGHWDKTSTGAKRAERMSHRHGNNLPRTLLSCSLTSVVFIFSLCTTRTPLIRFQGSDPVSKLPLSSLIPPKKAIWVYCTQRSAHTAYISTNVRECFVHTCTCAHCLFQRCLPNNLRPGLISFLEMLSGGKNVWMFIRDNIFVSALWDRRRHYQSVKTAHVEQYLQSTCAVNRDSWRCLRTVASREHT